MKKYLVLYYSKTGNSQFIAEKLAIKLGGVSKKIIPIIDSVVLLFLLSLLRIGIGTNVSKKEMEDYDEIIIVGPIWGGCLISPLRNTLKKSKKASKDIHFALTCETKEEEKNSKYGYAQVLKEAGELGGKWVKTLEAFPTSLVNMDSPSWTPKLSEKIKFTEDNFNAVLKLRLENFVSKIKSS